VTSICCRPGPVSGNRRAVLGVAYLRCSQTSRDESWKAIRATSELSGSLCKNNSIATTALVVLGNLWKARVCAFHIYVRWWVRYNRENFEWVCSWRCAGAMTHRREWWRERPWNLCSRVHGTFVGAVPTIDTAGCSREVCGGGWVAEWQNKNKYVFSLRGF